MLLMMMAQQRCQSGTQRCTARCGAVPAHRSTARLRLQLILFPRRILCLPAVSWRWHCTTYGHLLARQCWRHCVYGARSRRCVPCWLKGMLLHEHPGQPF
jgi:hypothetical protein